MDEAREIRFIGGPKDGEKISAAYFVHRVRMAVMSGADTFKQAVYEHYKGDIWLYDDGQERLRKARFTIKPRLTFEESEEEIRREVVGFLKKEGYARYDILQEEFKMTEQGYEVTFDVYIHDSNITK